MVGTGATFGKRTPEGGQAAAPRPAQPRAPVAATPPAAAAGEAYVECAFCAEQILARAKKCRHCGETVDPTLRKAEEAMRSLDRSPATVYMNAGGGFPAMQPQLRPYNHGLHLIVSLITGGLWLPVWLILYLLRDRSIYY